MDYAVLMATRAGLPQADRHAVIGWVSHGSVELLDLPDLGGWGGWIEHGQRWADYIDDIEAAKTPYFEALRQAILARGLRRGGDWHQNSAGGVPVFDDGSVATFTYRAWGDLLAAVWADADGRDYSYVDFYMDYNLAKAGMTPSG